MSESSERIIRRLKDRFALCNYIGLPKVLQRMCLNNFEELHSFLNAYSDIIVNYRTTLKNGERPKVLFVQGTRDNLDKFLVVFMFKYMEDQCYVFSAEDALVFENDIDEEDNAYRTYTEVAVLNLGKHLSDYGNLANYRDKDLLSKTSNRYNFCRGTLVLSEVPPPSEWSCSGIFTFINIPNGMNKTKSTKVQTNPIRSGDGVGFVN